MGIFDHALEKAIEIQATIIDRLSLQLYQCMLKNEAKPNGVRWAFITNFNNSKFIIMQDLSLNENQNVIALNGLFDIVTGAQITDAVFSNIVMSSSDESVATAAALPNGSVQFNAIPGGAAEPPSRTATVTGKANVSYTNSLGEQSQGSLLIVVNVTVLAVQTADGVEWRFIFGAPQVTVTP